MVIYEIHWCDRHKHTREWFGTKKEMVARRAEVNKTATKRPYDYIEILGSRPRDIPTDKPGLLKWLNEEVQQ